MSSIIIISAKSPEGVTGTRQISVPDTDKHLGKLNRLLYNTALDFFMHDNAAMLQEAGDCVLTLIGMSIGFVLISTFAYYRRVYFLSKELASHLWNYSHRKNR